ncbi:MAG: RNA polymerase factor sigma-32, partial [Gammaproteobacteria bacterium]|nr:RNA polymerase factor sigma-32 [Gammaproteobacteria bacterium]
MTAIATLQHASDQHLPVLSTGSLQGYLDTVQRIPVLDKDEEVKLFRRFQDEDDLEAARSIVMSHLRYVVFIARGYTGYGLPLEDLIQQGNVGLMKSVRRFSLDHKVRLVSFAVHWIKAEIHEFILKNWKIVKVVTTKAQRKLFFNLRKTKQRLGWFNQEEVDQVAKTLGVKPGEVMEMERRLTVIDEPFESVDTDEDHFRPGPAGYLTAGESEDPAMLAADEEISEMQSRDLQSALESLDDRARDIVTSRWLMDSKTGLRELS